MPSSKLPEEPTILELLRRINFLSRVEEPTLVRIAGCVKEVTFEANQHLFSEGDFGDYMYLVVEGWIRIEKYIRGGEKLVIARRGPGSHLGELALFDDETRMADAFAHTKCKLLSLDKESFIRCVLPSQNASLAIMASLAEMVRNAGTSLQSLRGLTAEERVVNLLIAYAKSHGQRMPGGEILITTQVTHNALADQAGVSREWVTKIFKELTLKQVIRRVGRSLYLRDITMLQAMADKATERTSNARAQATKKKKPSRKTGL